MINNVNSQPNFTSTKIFTKGVNRAVSDYTNVLNKYFVEVKGFGNVSVEKARNLINHNQAALVYSKEAGSLAVVTKEKDIDKFIFNQLRKVDKNVEFVDDAPELVSNMPAMKLDMTI